MKKSHNQTGWHKKEEIGLLTCRRRPSNRRKAAKPSGRLWIELHALDQRPHVCLIIEHANPLCGIHSSGCYLLFIYIIIIIIILFMYYSLSLVWDILRQIRVPRVLLVEPLFVPSINERSATYFHILSVPELLSQNGFCKASNHHARATHCHL